MTPMQPTFDIRNLTLRAARQAMHNRASHRKRRRRMTYPRLTPAGMAGKAVFVRHGQILSWPLCGATGRAPNVETRRDEILGASAWVGRLEAIAKLDGEGGLAEALRRARGVHERTRRHFCGLKRIYPGGFSFPPDNVAGEQRTLAAFTPYVVFFPTRPHGRRSCNPTCYAQKVSASVRASCPDFHGSLPGLADGQ